MSTPLVKVIEVIYERESESPVPRHAIDLTYMREGDSIVPDQVPVLGDDLDIEDPMVPHYADTGGQLAQDEQAAMDPSNILNGADRLRHRRPFSADEYDEVRENGLPPDIRDSISGVSALRLTDDT
ncbi:uncharacterized protein N7482_007928 [Penicillium canariense]|uniref:Uncharacterized protein n=1 Tax=Penicillium canariense TaxID=189055 RepID=A0A9W9LKL8_9EURO|nr:uncharacterized protein N7482_007928 [Penicillium canariense]KAJ5160924.1 hypothetical protein N7482_007928 [Penicillium canariense]